MPAILATSELKIANTLLDVRTLPIISEDLANAQCFNLES